MKPAPWCPEEAAEKGMPPISASNEVRQFLIGNGSKPASTSGKWCLAARQ